MSFLEDDMMTSSNPKKEVLPLEGSPRSWNELWKKSRNRKSPLECLFTKESPKTIIEFWQRGYAFDLLSLIKKKSYHDFLELGSGRATTSMYLNEAGFQQITLVDLSEEAKNLAVKNFNKFHLKFKEFILADVRNTSLSNESFDCIYNIGLLEHFNQPEEVLQETFRLLRPGGLIFMPIFPEIKSPHCYLIRLLFNPFSFLKMIFKKETNSQGNMIRTKRQRLSYIKICEELGFVNVQCIYYNPFPKVIRDSTYENVIVLNAYKFVHYLRKGFNRKLRFQTSSFFGTAYLLVAYK